MLEPGDILGGYRIDRVLGQGGMGLVFEATQLSLDRKVALKVVASHLSAQAAFRERFRREGLLQAAADHPHILPVYEAGEDRGLLFLAMRLVRGPNLADLIQRQQLPLERTLTLLGQVADALDRAHELGMVHRDVKPQNILVDRGDYACLADFGITRALHDQGVTRMTQTGEFLGSIHYISPEQIHGLPPSAKSDLYAFAAVLYECVVGRPPFTAEVDAAVIFAHISEEPPRASVARPELPETLDAVLARGLAKDPELRYPTARDFIADARATLEASGAQRAARTLTSPAHPARASAAPSRSRRGALVGDRTEVSSPRRTKRARRLLGLGAASLTVVLTVSGFAIGNRDFGRANEKPGFAASGPIGLSLPPSWERLRKPPTIPGLVLADAISVGPVGSRRGLVAGRSQSRGPTLLPASMRGSMRLPKKVAVRLGAFEAYRYRGVRGGGLEGELTMYTVPTNRGVVTLACFGPSPADLAAFEACERVAATLELSGVKTYPLGPSRAFAEPLQKAISSLDAARGVLRQTLASSRTPAAQAKAARGLAGAYGSAARSLEIPDVGPEAAPAKRSIIDALRASEATHRRLAQAAVAGKKASYETARTSVAASEQRLTRSLQALSKLGYAPE